MTHDTDSAREAPKLTGLAAWWRRFRLGLDRIEWTLLVRIASTGYDEVPIVIHDRVDMAMVVGYIRLRERGFVDMVSKSGVNYGYAITAAGRAALAREGGK